MKIILPLLLISLTMVSGNPFMAAQQPLPEKYSVLILPLKAENDSNQKKYFKEVRKTDILTDQLIAKTKKLEDQNYKLHNEIKKLKKSIESLKQNVEIVYLHDTIFKRRKILELFKK